MSSSPNLLITGATGFIGGTLAARLLQTDRWDKCLFLVRAPHREDGLTRLAHILRKHEVPEALLDRLQLEQILCGDLTTVADWQDDPRLESITDVVSSAAVASFNNHRSIWPTNADGVLNMARALNRRCKIRRFIQIGTGMSAGMQAPDFVPEGYDAGADTEHFLEYTASKYAAELRIRRELPDFPLIVVRPSIVVGHTRLGCSVSGSIYWVFRTARALQTFPCELDQKIDVIPVDYCAEALHRLLEKPTLKYNVYHISASREQSCSFREIDQSIAETVHIKPMANYVCRPFEQIAEMKGLFREILGPCNVRAILNAIHSYGNFSKLGMLFDNRRLLDEGMAQPTPLKDYAGLCEQTSQGISIGKQMRVDYKS